MWAVVLAASLPSAWAEDRNVCAAGPPSCDFAQLQAAIDASLAGDVLHVTDLVPLVESVVADVGVVIVFDGVPTPIWSGLDDEPVLTVTSAEPVWLIDAALGGESLPDLVVVKAGGSFVAVGGVWTGSGRVGATVRAEPGASLTLRNVELRGAVGGGDGGAISATDAEVVLEDVALLDNQAGQGGGVHLAGGTLNATRLTLCDNSADFGGAVFATGASISMDNVVAVGNVATLDGGALWLGDGSGSVGHLTAWSNAAAEGAAVLLDTDGFLVKHSILANHVGTALSVVAGAVAPTEFVLFWANQDGNASVPIGNSDLVADPAFVSLRAGTDCGLDLRPLPDSPAVDAGALFPTDPDGSAQDLGAYGGPYSPPEQWVDVDADGSVALYDCAPVNPDVWPGAVEACDGEDGDCDGQIPLEEVDQDADGAVACGPWTGADSYVVGGDCDDLDGTRRPGAVETCDHNDDDCNGLVDDGAVDAMLWLVDADADGFGGGSDLLWSCDPVPGRVGEGGDCDDSAAGSFPGAQEWCDDVDSDCDGTDDDPEAADAVAQWTDADGDGFGSATDPVRACASVQGLADNPDDCNDTDPATFPGALETYYDGVDGDCEGGSDFDADGDGHDAGDFGGDDCDDSRASVQPAAREVPADGVDQDCDGVDTHQVGVSSCSTSTGPNTRWGFVGALAWMALRRRL